MKLLPKLQHAFGFAPLLAFAMAAPALTTQAAVLYPENDGFELPNLGATQFYAFGYGTEAYPSLNPASGSGVAWYFTNDAGISANGSGLANTNTANGNLNGGYQSAAGQSGFISNGNGFTSDQTVGGQTTIAQTFSQTITGFELGGYSITFSLQDWKYTGNTPSNGISVYIDTTFVGSYTAMSKDTFNVVTTPVIDLTAGSHTLWFVGNTGNTTTFIDSVSINAVPEPGTYALLLVAGAVLFIAVRNKRRNQDGSLEVSRS